jgi:hypothetical protein
MQEAPPGSLVRARICLFAAMAVASAGIFLLGGNPLR